MTGDAQVTQESELGELRSGLKDAGVGHDRRISQTDFADQLARDVDAIDGDVSRHHAEVRNLKELGFSRIGCSQKGSCPDARA